ncbi:MAG: hypothetical protein WBA28_05485 [Microbacteriaceae bacterium]
MIEEILTKAQNGRVDDDRYIAFTVRVRDSDKLSGKSKDLLYEYAKLRNVIVHEPWTSREEPIATPLLKTVEEIELIQQNLEKPPTVIGILGQRSVETLDADVEISTFLEMVDDPDNYSQAPIRGSDGALHLMTTNAVARWVAKGNRDNGGIMDLTATIADVLKFAEDDTD